jgi:hypothetical protein
MSNDSISSQELFSHLFEACNILRGQLIRMTIKAM